MVLEIFGVGKWDSDFWEFDGDLNADVLEDETDTDGSDSWSDTVGGRGTAARIVLRATSDFAVQGHPALLTYIYGVRIRQYSRTCIHSLF